MVLGTRWIELNRWSNLTTLVVERKRMPPVRRGGRVRGQQSGIQKPWPPACGATEGLKSWNHSIIQLRDLSELWAGLFFQKGPLMVLDPEASLLKGPNRANIRAQPNGVRTPSNPRSYRTVTGDWRACCGQASCCAKASGPRWSWTTWRQGGMARTERTPVPIPLESGAIRYDICVFICGWMWAAGISFVVKKPRSQWD